MGDTIQVAEWGEYLAVRKFSEHDREKAWKLIKVTDKETVTVVDNLSLEEAMSLRKLLD